MTLAHGSDQLESDRLVLRRVGPGDLPFFARIHGLPEVARYLWPGGRPRSCEQTASWMRNTLASYERLALGYLAVVRKENNALIGRCGLMELVIESAAPEHGLRKGWFGQEGLPVGVRLTFEDKGPGIPDIEQALRDGFTTGRGMGLGLGGAKRLSNEFSIASRLGEGTKIVIARWK